MHLPQIEVLSVVSMSHNCIKTEHMWLSKVHAIVCSKTFHPETCGPLLSWPMFDLFTGGASKH